MSNSHQLEPARSSNGQMHAVPLSRVQRRMPSVASAREESESGMSLGFFFSVWNHWWKALVPISLLLAILSSAIVWVTFRPQYRAAAQLEVADKSPFVIVKQDDQKVVGYVDTQIEILRSERVLHATLSDPRVAAMREITKRNDPIRWLQEKGLEIEPIKMSALVSVAYKGPDPDASAHFVNRIIDNYFDVVLAQKNLRTEKIVTILNQAKTTQEATVARLQEQVRELGKNLPDADLVSGADVVVNRTSDPLQMIFDAVMKADLERATMEAEVSALEGSLSDDRPFDVPSEIVQAKIDGLEEVQAKRLEMQQAEAGLAIIASVAKQGENSNEYKAHLSKVQSLKDQLEILRVQRKESVERHVMATSRLERQQELDIKKQELAAKIALVENLDQKLRDQKTERTKQGGARIEFEFAQMDLQLARNRLASISERLEQMGAERMAPSQVERFRRASPPSEPVAKYPLIGMAIAILSSLCVPYLGAVLWENTIRRITSVDQLESASRIGVIGEISKLPPRSRRLSGTRVVGHELGLFEESIDSLRTGLMLSHGHEIQVLTVASAVSGEGKTSVSSQLAVSIARSTGQPVLLIDGDMRAPDIHEIFEIPMTPGLAEVLDGQASLDKAINRTWSDHVHILPAGDLHKSPHKLLGTPAFRAMLDEARLWYRYIVIDTPPVLAASEALVIAKEADATLVCSMRDFSREHHVRLAHEKLRATGADTLGTVLNGVPVRSYAYKYGTYGRYGYADRAKG